MKISRFAAVLVFMVISAGCGRNDIVNIDSRGRNIICFGDSITRGKGADPGESYPAALAKISGYPVINAGINSDISPEALKRLKSDILENDPLLVIIEFGGNDYLSRIPLAQTVSNVDEMIRAIQAAGAMVALADISNSIFMGEYNQEFKRLSRAYKTIFIPRLLEDIVADPGLKSDEIHPNAKGYRIIAYRVYRQIFPYLNLNSIRRGRQNKLFDSSRSFR